MSIKILSQNVRSRALVLNNWGLSLHASKIPSVTRWPSRASLCPYPRPLSAGLLPPEVFYSFSATTEQELHRRTPAGPASAIASPPKARLFGAADGVLKPNVYQINSVMITFLKQPCCYLWCLYRTKPSSAVLQGGQTGPLWTEQGVSAPRQQPQQQVSGFTLLSSYN